MTERKKVRTYQQRRNYEHTHEKAAVLLVLITAKQKVTESAAFIFPTVRTGTAVAVKFCIRKMLSLLSLTIPQMLMKP